MRHSNLLTICLGQTTAKLDNRMYSLVESMVLMLICRPANAQKLLLPLFVCFVLMLVLIRRDPEM